MNEKRTINLSGYTLEEIKIFILKKIQSKDRQNTFIEFICPKCNKLQRISCKVLLKREELICRSCKQSSSLSSFIKDNKEEWVSRWKNAIQDKYEVDNIAHHSETQDRKKENCMKKYGVEYAIASKEVRDAINKTFEEKYNGAHTPFASNDVQKKVYETNLKNHNGIHSSKTDECKNKCKKTCMEKFGVPYAGKTEEYIQKKHSTNLERYGVEESWASENNKEIRKKTMMEKYGVEFYMQDTGKRKEVLQNRYDTTGHMYPTMKGYRYDDKNFDSSYELAYYIWLRDNNRQFIYHPGTPLSYIGDDNLEHEYLPDFLIDGKFYEIKGDQFFNEKNEPWDPYKKKFWWEKYNSLLENKVSILRDKDLKPIFEYINTKYGKTFLKGCKSKKESRL